MPSPATIRETVESFVIAVVLAFLFRTFEAEAFVIPTGSMAPTLMGRHKDFECPKCGFNYQVSASDEVDNDGRPKGREHETLAGTCPMCRYTAAIGPKNPQNLSYPSYSGDRILVEKFAYELDDPKRWDVIVFKFPGDTTTDSRTNFIKRLVGLPGETIRIKHGDLWVRRDDEPFQIVRKPPEKLLAMLQPVFDNEYMPKVAELGWPVRWEPEPSADGSTSGAWSSDNYTMFRTDGSGAGERWLRYHHRTPSFSDWRSTEHGEDASKPKIDDQLIRDFTAYDTTRAQKDGSPVPTARSLGQYWVGDLALRCTVDVESDKGELLFELRKGGRLFHCRIDVATGEATLSISGPGMEQFHPKATTAVRGSGRHEIRFSNCDNELRLWVDDRIVTFDAKTSYPDLKNTTPDPTDTLPVGVGTVGVKAQVSHLAIFRDIYYIADDLSSIDSRMYSANGSQSGSGMSDVRNGSERQVDFVLKADQFFVLGDNSAMSKDGREWGSNNYWVPRELLIGKALFIYWPHSWNRIPYVKVPFPFFPNFARMELVR
jgi:signal peptidase I